jgi:hypothetical protein
MAGTENRRLLAHLMRRAGFRATSSELNELSKSHMNRLSTRYWTLPINLGWGEHLIRRFHHEQSGMMSAFGPIFKAVT